MVTFTEMTFKGVPIHEGTSLDYPTAWAIQSEVGAQLEHDPKCSAVPGHHPMSGPHFLCDCGAVEREWERRNG